MPQTLLLADDSITIQRVIELTFADEDIQVVAVGDGDQAIERLETAPPDIVLADVGMPGRSGYEVARYIKQSPKLSHIPVVLLTGAFEPVDQAKAAAAGCDGVLAKPFEPQLVIGRVKELLARRRPVSQSLEPLLAAEAESFAPPLAERSFEAPASQAGESATVDTYFDRLGEAFSNLSAAPRGAAEPPPFAAAADDLSLAYRAPSTNFDMFTSSSAPTPAIGATLIEKASPSSTPVSIEWPRQVEAVQPTFQPPAPAPSAAASVTLPPIADAFAALLAAEQNQPTLTAAVPWPTSPPQDMSIDTADLVEQVTRRVLERLSDRVVRETVTDIVSSVAERAVREEIERIKASIK